MSDKVISFEIIEGVGGLSLCAVKGVDTTCTTRIAGPKPWGGGKVIKKFIVDIEKLEEILNETE